MVDPSSPAVSRLCFPRQADLYLENNFCPDMFKCSQTLLALLVSLSSSLCARYSEVAPSKAECVSGRKEKTFLENHLLQFLFLPSHSS